LFYCPALRTLVHNSDGRNIQQPRLRLIDDRRRVVVTSNEVKWRENKNNVKVDRDVEKKAE